MPLSNIASYVDYTLLRADATASEIDVLCDIAAHAGFHAVCVNGVWVKRARARLTGGAVSVVTVVGFPLGADPVPVKVSETTELIDEGADEIDMVVSLGHLVDGDSGYVTNEIRRVVQAARGRTVKCILETAALSHEQIVSGARAALAAGAHFVKTSTGMNPKGGATEAAVSLLSSVVGERMGVKASGGIRDLETAERMIAAGATRIGTSTNLSVP